MHNRRRITPSKTTAALVRLAMPVSFALPAVFIGMVLKLFFWGGA